MNGYKKCDLAARLGVVGSRWGERMFFAGGLLGRFDAQFFQHRGDVRAVGTGLDLLVDGQNFSVFADVERPAERQLSFVGHHAVGSGRNFQRIAQNGIVQFKRFGERLVALGPFDLVATGGEIGDVELANLFAARTERLALGRSATGKGLGIPGDDHRLTALEVGQLVGFSV